MADDVVRLSSRAGWMAPIVRTLQREQLLKILHREPTLGLTMKDLQELLFDLLDEARVEPLDVLRAINRTRRIPDAKL